MHDFSLRHLSDDALLEGLAGLVATDRLTTARLLAHLVEVERRRLHLPAGFSSVYRYCVDRLRMSADVAYKRVRAARAVRRHPAILGAIADGRLNLSGVAMLATHLTRANACELVAAAENKTRREIEQMLAWRFPATEAGAANPDAITHAPTPARGTGSPGSGTGPTGTPGSIEPGDPVHADVTSASERQAPGPVPSRAPGVTAVQATAPPHGARLTTIAPNRVELVAVIGEAARAQLEASRELLAHAVPSGDLAEVLERAIALQHAQLRKRRCAATDRARADAGAADASGDADPRRVPAAVRREVWKRDQGRCAFVGADGHRCAERSRLELDHVVPVARGGRSTADNLRLLCRAHNQHAAEGSLGRERVRVWREAARRRRAADRHFKQAEQGRAEKRRAEIARQEAELGETLRRLGYRGEPYWRALACCTARADAPPAERLEYALGCLPPAAPGGAPKKGRAA